VISLQTFGRRSFLTEAELSSDGYCSNCHLKVDETVRSAVRRGEAMSCPNCIATLRAAALAKAEKKSAA
jgi:NAD-dependent SIR2 family protein deacetylase